MKAQEMFIKLIIFHGRKVAYLDGKYVSSSEASRVLSYHLKRGTAKKVVDNVDTLMYILKLS